MQKSSKNVITWDTEMILSPFKMHLKKKKKEKIFL